MADNDLITQITNIIIEQTINEKIPTVVFLSDIEKRVLVKNLFGTIKGGNRNTETFTQEEWKEISNIMEELAEIPLLLKEINNINKLKEDTENFIVSMEGRKGLVIINSKENISDKNFTTNENISIMII